MAVAIVTAGIILPTAEATHQCGGIWADGLITHGPKNVKRDGYTTVEETIGAHGEGIVTIYTTWSASDNHWMSSLDIDSEMLVNGNAVPHRNGWGRYIGVSGERVFVEAEVSLPPGTYSVDVQVTISGCILPGYSAEGSHAFSFTYERYNCGVARCGDTALIPPACPGGTVGATPPACTTIPPPPCPAGTVGATPPACAPEPSPCPSGTLGVMSPACIPTEVPTGVTSCAAYNARYSPSPYPGQNSGIVIEYDPAGPEGDVALCAGVVTGAPCDAGQPGVLVDNAPTCVPNACPDGANADTLAACGVGPLCSSGLSNASPATLAACGVGPLCASGVTNVDPSTVAACGFGPVCPGGVTSPPGPGQLAVVCGVPVFDPCPGGAGSVDPMTVEACGAGPLCPGGVASPPGPGEAAVVCGVPLSACSLSGSGAGPGWTVGAQGVCVGLPWAQPGGAPDCPSSATVNVRVHWGTTPTFAPGSTFDVCF